MRNFLPYVSLLLLLLLPRAAKAQQLFPTADGQRMRYQATIEMQRGYVSGICIVVCNEGEVRGSLFNEFGLTALDFTYYPTKDKVRLHSLVPMLDKWYIRRTLRHDLRLLIGRLRLGQTTYRNQRRGIDYTFTPLPDETTR